MFLTGCFSRTELSCLSNTVTALPTEETSILFSDLLLEIRSAVAKDDQEAAQELQDWRSINKDVYALLEIPELGIDEPVVGATESNNQWLRTNIYGKYSVAGCVFLDYRCKLGVSPVTLIHGHNMKNGTMFGNLPDLLKLENCSDAPIIKLYTEAGWLEYEVFSVISVDSKEEALPVETLATEEDVVQIQEDLLSRSVVPGGEIHTSDLLVLNTCWYGESGVERNLHCIVSASRV